MSTVYNKEELAALKRWIHNVQETENYRKYFKPTILNRNMSNTVYGYTDKCRICGTPINVKFGDYSQPLSERLIKCPNGSTDDGHGLWASVIQLNEN